MQAIILAAGMGKRLGHLTSHNTKCMIEVNGTRLIDRMLNQLMSLNLSKIILVIGYKAQNLKNYVNSRFPNFNIIFIENDIFYKTNNIYSLWLAKDFMSQDDTLLLESDLIFEDKVLYKALKSPYKDCALVSKYQTWNDGTMVRIDEDNNIINFIPKKAFKYSDTQFYYKTVNIYKFSKDFAINHYLPFLEAYIKVLGENEYYEQVLRVITLIDNAGIKALPISGLKWYEIDDIQDLKIAETIFAGPIQRLEKLQKSYGGYWRFPELTDFCYLVNPYFPTQRMIEEMKANFENLLRDYPSGMSVNTLLASKYFGISQDYIVVGNGAAELIKSLLEKLDGNFGITFPTFEEYSNRLPTEKIIKFCPQNRDFHYSADDLINYYSLHSIENLLLINPDNPSGNFINLAGLYKLLNWSQKNNIKIIIDESFIDFAEDGLNSSLLIDNILSSHSNLYVIKSISKSYGVPGLRLGVLASSNKDLIKKIRNDVAIWNINSFAEFYMQIYGKYEKDYQKACKKFLEERNIFQKELESINFLKVIPTQANYFLCEILDKYTSKDFTLKLLTDYNILIKDCSTKKGFNNKGEYIRIAVRDRDDNKKLIEALKAL